MGDTHHTYGILMNAEAFRSLLGCVQIVKDLDFASYESVIPTTPLSNFIASAIYYHNKCYMSPKAIDHAFACATADNLFPGLLQELKIVSSATDKIKNLRGLINQTLPEFLKHLKDYTAITVEEYTEELEEPGNNLLVLPVDCENVTENLAEEYLSKYYATINFLLTKGPAPDVRRNVLACVAALVVTFAKKKITKQSPFVARFRACLTEDMGYAPTDHFVRIHNILVREVLPIYENSEHPKGEKFERLLNFLPDSAMALKVCIVNAIGLRMSQIRIVKVAVCRNPAFNWYQLCRILPGGSLSSPTLMTAIDAITNDKPIQLLNQNPNATVWYRGLVYTAEQLLMQVNGVVPWSRESDTEKRGPSDSTKIKIDSLVIRHRERLEHDIWEEHKRFKG